MAEIPCEYQADETEFERVAYPHLTGGYDHSPGIEHIQLIPKKILISVTRNVNLNSAYLLSICDSTCSFLTMPTGKLISNLGNTNWADLTKVKQQLALNLQKTAWNISNDTLFHRQQLPVRQQQDKRTMIYTQQTKKQNEKLNHTTAVILRYNSETMFFALYLTFSSLAS